MAKGGACHYRESREAEACFECNAARVACSLAKGYKRPKRKRTRSPSDSPSPVRSKRARGEAVDVEVLADRIVAGFADALHGVQAELRGVRGELRALVDLRRAAVRRVRFGVSREHGEPTASSPGATGTSTGVVSAAPEVDALEAEVAGDKEMDVDGEPATGVFAAMNASPPAASAASGESEVDDDDVDGPKAD